MREFVLKEDALDVVEILRHSVEQVYTDEYGSLDRTRGGAGGMSNRKARKIFAEKLRHIVGAGNSCSLDDLRRVADMVNSPLGDFNSMIDDMRNNGSLIKKPDGRYELVT